MSSEDLSTRPWTRQAVHKPWIGILCEKDQRILRKMRLWEERPVSQHSQKLECPAGISRESAKEIEAWWVAKPWCWRMCQPRGRTTRSSSSVWPNSLDLSPLAFRSYRCCGLIHVQTLALNSSRWLGEPFHRGRVYLESMWSQINWPRWSPDLWPPGKLGLSPFSLFWTFNHQEINPDLWTVPNCQNQLAHIHNPQLLQL